MPGPFCRRDPEAGKSHHRVAIVLPLFDLAQSIRKFLMMDVYSVRQFEFWLHAFIADSGSSRNKCPKSRSKDKQ